jgi:hypothetical protein
MTSIYTCFSFGGVLSVSIEFGDGPTKVTLSKEKKRKETLTN